MKRIAGFDNHGRLYDNGSHMRRSIDQDYLATARDVFNALKADLPRLGVVETEYHPEEKMFAHKKHIINYPHEWTANMLKEAALFHLEFLQRLDERGFTLKDALPSNILFDFTTPIFVDFLSMVRKEALAREDYLVAAAGAHLGDLRRVVLQLMYYPYFLIPLLEMGRRNFGSARTQLSTQACNQGNGRPRLKGRGTRERMLDLLKASVGITNNRVAETLIMLKVRRILARRSHIRFTSEIGALRRLIERLDVTPPKSGYVGYYELKKEDFDTVNQSSWKPKQVNAFKVLEQTRPRRVLDIGANTGWYSVLAERQGAEVIATDVDESSIETLYQYSRSHNLKILSLNIPFEALETEMPIRQTPAQRDDAHDGETPLFMKATERLNTDLVFCLGLLHHLVLGAGMPLDRIFTTLGKLAGRTLLLEFVSMDDPLVAAEPSFFPSIAKYNSSSYNLDAVISAGLARFKTHHVLDSNGSTRKLVVFEK